MIKCFTQQEDVRVLKLCAYATNNNFKTGKANTDITTRRT